MPTFWDKVIERLKKLDPERQERYLTSLARERGLLHSVFNTIEDAVIVLDAEGRIEFINRAARHLLGITGSNPLNRPLLRYLVDGKLLEIFQGQKLGATAGGSLAEADEAGAAFSTEIEVRRPRPMVLKLSALPLRSDDDRGTGGMVIVLHDATTERRRQLAAFQSEKLGALSTLAAGVAHEIGNPLNSLGIHMQLLEREIATLEPGSQRDELAARVETSKQEIERLDGIIRQFLGAVRPSKLDYRPVQINALLESLLDFAYYEIDRQQIGVEKRYDPAIPAVLMDEAQIKQACLNIIKNAVQAMPHGGLLTVETKLASDEITITFADTGVGIPAERLGQIFDPFFTTKDRGSGLGLMIVYKIVKDHDGRVDVESEVGRGTRVTIALPALESRRRLIEDTTSKSAVFEATTPEPRTPEKP